MSRQTECRDYSNGKFPGMAVVRANNRYHCVTVAQRLSSKSVVPDRFADRCSRTKLAEALDDLHTCGRRDGTYTERQDARLTAFAIAFAWLLLANGAGDPEAALRLEVDPVCGLVGYVSQLAGEIRFLGNTLLACDPLAGEETLLDHLRGTTALASVLPDPRWYCFEREWVDAGEGDALSLLAAGGTRYRFFFDTAPLSSQDQHGRLVGILVPLIAQALGYSSLALDRCRSLFQRMWRVDWYSEGWQPIHIRALFGRGASVQYEHLLQDCFEEACTLLSKGGET